MLPIAPRGNRENPTDSIAGEQERVVRGLFGPKTPCGIEQKNGKSAAGVDFGNFLDEEGPGDSTDHAGRGAGGGDFPVDGVEFPAGEGAGEGDGDDQGEGGAHGNMIRHTCLLYTSPSPRDS